MNFLIGSVVRSLLNNAVKRISHSNFLPYSTAINNTPESPECQEPDKLYKEIQIEMRAHTPATLKSYSQFLKMAADYLKIPVKKCFFHRKPRIDREGLTVLRSRFVHKKHRTQYEVRTYFGFVYLEHLTGSTADTYLEYIERNLPEGVALKITKIALEKLPPEVLTPPDFVENSSEKEPKEISG